MASVPMVQTAVTTGTDLGPSDPTRTFDSFKYSNMIMEFLKVEWIVKLCAFIATATMMIGG